MNVADHMERITLEDFETQFEAVLDKAGQAPIMITKDGRDLLVVLLSSDYDGLVDIAKRRDEK